MALQSPGVQVTVIDESFYTPAEPGTTPLIVVATAQDKSNAAGTGTASATTKANAGKAFRLTSQKDLVDLFGVPFFEKTPSASPVHGGERNEYGLLTAYSFLGVSNNAFLVRADIDLDELEGSAAAPGAAPTDGQWWVNTESTQWGIQEWNSALPTVVGGQKFTTKTPIVLTNDDSSKITDDGLMPKESVGSIGDYAVVFTVETGIDTARIYYKSAGGGITQDGAVTAGQWVLVGSPEWVASWPVVTTGSITSLTEGNSFTVNDNLITVSAGTVAAKISNLISSINGLSTQGISAKLVGSDKIAIYSDGSTSNNDDSTLSGSISFANVSGTPLGDLGLTAAKSYLQPKLHQSPHTSVPTYKRTDNPDSVQGYPTGSLWIKTTEPGGGASWRISKYSASTAVWTAYTASLYSTTHAAIYYLDRANGGSEIPTDTVFVQFNSTEDFGYAAPDADTNTRDTTYGQAEFRIWRRQKDANTGFTTVESNAILSNTFVSGTTYTFTIKQSTPGSADLTAAATISFTATASNTTNATLIAAAINAASFVDSNGDEVSNYVEAGIVGNDENKVSISHKAGGDMRMTDGNGTPLAKIFAAYNIYAGTGTMNLYAAPVGAAEDFVATSWMPLASEDFIASANTPLNEPDDGQLWYNPEFSDVDLMVHNGTTWVGFNNHSDYTQAQIIVSASQPVLTTAQKNIDKHIWISTADLENFPTIYRWSSGFVEWQLLDKSDQTSEEGVLFADARYGISGETGNTAVDISEYRTADYLDPDAPDPALYPRGMLLWNLRRSGGNVKRYNDSYIDTGARNTRMPGDPLMTDYATDRWTTASANNEDGSGSFGRKAQRKVVQAAMKSVIDTSSEIRDEERRNFNIIAAPGYPEVLSNLINLNIDRGLTAFVIGDTPLRLPSDATSLVNWGTNARLVTDNGDDGIVSYDEYCAVYYPNGFTTDLSGTNAVVPASHMMLRTIALSDQVSYPWFAPAGTRRGGITNATAVGYIDAATGEFQTVALNEGTRDVLYDLKVNPIPFFVGVGLVAFGQKTRARNASALDRINVARLTVYLRSQLAKLARPYLFEPNDKITRDEIKGAVESLLLELVGLRAIYDFAVVCDETNNTPSRIDRNELYVDIAIEPVKAVEFIYIPLRLKNTGEI
jgi:hypothetical protein